MFAVRGCGTHFAASAARKIGRACFSNSVCENVSLLVSGGAHKLENRRCLRCVGFRCMKTQLRRERERERERERFMYDI